MNLEPSFSINETSQWQFGDAKKLFPMVMSAEAASISAAYHFLFTLSYVLMIAGVAVFLFIGLLSIVALVRSFQKGSLKISKIRAAHFSLFSTAFAILIRLEDAIADNRILDYAVILTLIFLVIIAGLY
ncbi:MAG: hypothetical protein QW812_03295, partial [Thermoplasmataceae archaeon]